jgi:hypothetical protein
MNTSVTSHSGSTLTQGGSNPFKQISTIQVNNTSKHMMNIEDVDDTIDGMELAPSEASSHKGGDPLLMMEDNAHHITMPTHMAGAHRHSLQGAHRGSTPTTPQIMVLPALSTSA